MKKQPEKEHRLEKDFQFHVQELVRLFRIIKKNVHYGHEISEISTFMSTVMTYATLETTRKDILCYQFGATIRDDNTPFGFSITCAAGAQYPREMLLSLCKDMYHFWESTFWKGEWGENAGIHIHRQNEGIPDPPDKIKYFVAGEDIQENDPVELIDGKFYLHHDMKGK